MEWAKRIRAEAKRLHCGLPEAEDNLKRNYTPDQAFIRGLMKGEGGSEDMDSI